jgi:RNA polymerase sigma-70 factor (ECF subfamily)
MMSTLSQTLGAVPVMTDNGSRPVQRPASAPNVRTEAESSMVLVQRARTGDEAACNELCARYLPRLTRWAHGRLPASARDALQTTDLVQETFLQFLRNLDAFEPRHPGAFQGYLRRTLTNRIRDEIRRVQRRGVPEAINVEPASPDPSPLEAAVGRETLDVYEAALERLKDTDREAAIMRIELGFDYAEIMEALGKPTIAATQMAVRRALVRLAEEMTCVRPR